MQIVGVCACVRFFLLEMNAIGCGVLYAIRNVIIDLTLSQSIQFAILVCVLGKRLESTQDRSVSSASRKYILHIRCFCGLSKKMNKKAQHMNNAHTHREREREHMNMHIT